MKTCIVCNNDHDGTFGTGKYCSRSCISKFASLSRTRETINKINEANKGKHRSIETREKIGNTIKETISNFSDEKKLAIKNAHSIKHKQHKPYKKWTNESRRNMSLLRTEHINNGKGHCKYYDVWNGEKFIKLQGTWERRIGESLTKFNIKWERIIIPFNVTKHYTPDFYLPEFNIYLEVKGFMTDKNIIKYKEVIKETGITLKLIDSLHLITLIEEGKLSIFDLHNFDEQYNT